MNCLCAIYVDRNQQTFLAKMTSLVMRYDIIYHTFLINSQCLMMWGVDSPVSGVTGCFAHKLIHPNVYLSFFKPEKRNKHEKQLLHTWINNLFKWKLHTKHIKSQRYEH